MVTQNIPAPAMPTRTPAALGSMRMGTLFYKPALCEAPYLVDISGASEECIATARALQGLLAREVGGKVYLLRDSEEKFWMERLVQHHAVSFTPLSLKELFSQYRSLVKGLVLYTWEPDPATTFEYNVALTMSSVSDRLPVTAPVLSYLQELGYTQEVEDIRGRFTKLEAYEWAVETLMPLCSCHYVGATHQSHGYNDYIYATRSFCFYLDWRIEEENAMMRKILSAKEFVHPAIMFGYNNDGDESLDLAIEYGFSYIVSDWFSNQCYFASFPSPEKPYRQSEAAPLKAENGRIYVSLYFSDGDNIQFNQRLSQLMWRNPDRGAYPVGMQLNPCLFECAPPMLEWYYETITANDEIIGGPAGFSYAWEDKYPDTCWPAWHATNNFFLNAAGITVSNTSKLLLHPGIAEKFTSYTALKGCNVWDYTPYDCETVPYGEPRLINGVPLVITRSFFQKDQLYTFPASLETAPDHPKFICLCLTQAVYGPDAYTYIRETVQRLEKDFPGKFVFVSPSELMATVKAYKEK